MNENEATDIPEDEAITVPDLSKVFDQDDDDPDPFDPELAASSEEDLPDGDNPSN